MMRTRRPAADQQRLHATVLPVLTRATGAAAHGARAQLYQRLPFCGCCCTMLYFAMFGGWGCERSCRITTSQIVWQDVRHAELLKQRIPGHQCCLQAPDVWHTHQHPAKHAPAALMERGWDDETSHETRPAHPPQRSVAPGTPLPNDPHQAAPRQNATWGQRLCRALRRKTSGGHSDAPMLRNALEVQRRSQLSLGSCNSKPSLAQIKCNAVPSSLDKRLKHRGGNTVVVIPFLLHTWFNHIGGTTSFKHQNCLNTRSLSESLGPAPCTVSHCKACVWGPYDPTTVASRTPPRV